MPQELRKTGIDIIGGAPWASHFCQFYDTKQDLTDILVPYFKAGLENNEFCMWVTAPPLSAREALKAMRAAMPDFDSYLEKKQIEIVPHDQWYIIDGVFDMDRVLAGWIQKTEDALACGFDGLRLTGNTTWLERKDRADFKAYEAAVNAVIGKYKMLVLCTYRLRDCTASDVLDVMANHEFALIKQGGEWKTIERTANRQAKEELSASNEELRCTTKELTASNEQLRERGEELARLNRDITASERRYRQLIETTNEGVWLAGTDGKTIYVNQRMADMLGVPVAELLKSRRDDFFAPDYYERAMAIRKQREMGFSGQYELKLLRKDGTPLWVLVSGSPVHDEGGKHIANLGMHKDITDIKAAEEQLAYQAKLIEVVHDPVVASDKDYKLTSWNKAAESLFGWTAEEVLGKVASELLRTEYPAGTSREEVRKLIADRGSWAGEAVTHRKDGSRVNVLVSVGALRDAGGRYDGAVFSYHDITDIKKAEEEQLRLNRELRAIGECNAAMVRAADEKTLLSEVCRIICDSAGYRMAWVGTVEHDAAKTILPVAWSGVEDGYLAGANITWADVERGRGPTGAAARTGRTYFFQDFAADPAAAPWREAALQRGYRSSIAIALKDNAGGVFAVFTMYAGQPNGFNPAEVRLLEGLARDLAFEVTALRLKEENRKAEEKFRNLVENAPVGMALSTKDGRTTSRNNYIATMLGYDSPEELAKVPITDTYADPADRTRMLNLATNGLLINLEIQRKRKDGALIWTSQTGVPLGGGSDEIIYVSFDVTSRKQAEQELEKAREEAARQAAEIKTAMDAMQDVVLVYDSELRCIRANAAAEKTLGVDMTGIRPDGRTGLAPNSRTRHLDGRPLTADERPEARSLKGEFVRDEMFLTTDTSGRDRIFNTSSSPIVVGGEIIGAVSVSHDDTERFRAAEALLESEERFRTVLENSRDVIVGFDFQTGRYEYVSPAVESLVGYTPDEFTGMDSQTALGMVHPDNVSVLLAAYAKSVETGDAEAEYRQRTKGGEWKWVSTHMSVVKDSAGRPLYRTNNIRDINELKKAEEALKLNEARMGSLVRISQYPAKNVQDILDFVLNEAVKLSGSAIGYIYRYDEENRQLVLNSWSKEVAAECSIVKPDTVYDLDKTGIWGEVIRKKKTVIVNDFDAPNPLKKGYPAGHAPLHRWMGIPVVQQGKIVATLGLANKDSDYYDSDVQQLTLFMDSVWNYVERKWAEEDLKGSQEKYRQQTERLQATLDAAPAMIWTAHDKDALGITGNRAAQEFLRLRGNVNMSKSGPGARQELAHYAVYHGDALLSPAEMPLQKVATTGKPLAEYEMDFVFDDGSYRTTMGNVTPVFAANGEPAGAVSVFIDITERQLIEAALKVSEEKYRRIIETANEGVWINDADAKTTFANGRMADMLGYTVDELMGKTPADFVVEGEELETAEYGERLELGLRVQQEFKLRRKDGTVIWVIMNAAPVTDDDGNFAGAVSMLTDITARRQVEDEVQASHRFLEIGIRHDSVKTLLPEFVREINNLTGCEAAGIRLLDADGNIPYIAYEGFSQEFYEQESPLSVKTDKCMCSRVINRNTDPSQSYYTPFGSFYSNGTTRFIAAAPAELRAVSHNVCNAAGFESVALVPIRAGSRVIGLVHVADRRENMVPLSTVTLLERASSILGISIQRVLSVEALRTSEERYRQVVETASEGIWVVDTEGVTTYVNQRMADTMGYSREEMVGKIRTDFIIAEDIPALMQMRKERKKGIASRYETRFIRKDGSVMWMLVSGSPMFDAGGKHTSNLGMHLDVTESKLAEAKLEEYRDRLEDLVKERTSELAESETKFRNLVENAPVGISIITLDGRAVFRNGRVAEMGGYTPEEMERILVSERYLRIEDRSRFLDMARKGVVRGFETELKAKNGEHYWVSMAGIPQMTEFGEGVITISEDITERKRAEERIRYLATFPELNPTFIVELDERGNIRYTNPAMKNTFPDIGQMGIGHPYLAGFDSLRKAVRDGGDKPFPRELQVGDAWYEQVIHYLPETRRFRIYGRNITSRRKASEEQRNASLYARSLIEASLDPLVTINAIGKITDVNQATEIITGVKRDELVGTVFSDYFTEPEKATESYQQFFAKGPVRDFPLTVRHVSGKETDVLYNATIFRDEDDEVQGVVAVARDITHLKALETELRRSNSDLQQFAYITSHDLQEPLRMITSYLQLLERRYKNKLDADADEFIGFAVEGAARMRTMISDLLEYSRIETRGKPMLPTSTENALAAALSNLQVAIQENCAVVTHDPLPVVRADPTQLIMLFQNLVGNGVKFHGKEAPCVHVSAVREGKEWRFAVKDNGIGIEPQYFGRLFQVFQRLHTREEYPGTGIGLALCKRIIERHGGRIWIESEAGRGTTFYFTIPVGGQ